MTRKSANIWLALSAIMIVISIILFLLPVSTKKPEIPTDVHNRSDKADSVSVVTRIIDGDTFVLSGGAQVRLIGVDTPEKGQPFYESARAFAESTILGSPVVIEFDEEPLDNYDRALAYIFMDSILYNEEIVRAGLASVYLFKNNRKYASKLLSAQKSARETGTGIWSLDPPSPEEHYVSVEGSFRFHRPLCPNLKKSAGTALRRFATREEPLDLGLSPCRFCRP